MEILRVPPSPALRRWSREHGYSPELVARWGAFYGDLPELLAALDRPPASFLRLNPLQGNPHETTRRLQQKGFRLEPTGIPFTMRVTEQPFSIGATEEYLLGLYHLQDASSALAAMALEARGGETIADLCAAPGGKTIQIAAGTADEARILAFDSDPERVRGLVSNLARCGVASAAVYSAPAQTALRLGLQFDRVLLDPPCTGEGVIQRDPSRRQGHLGEFASCARTQHELLDVANQILRPGGVLVYSTCTLAPEENEVQVHEALQRLGLVIEPLPAALRNLRLGGSPLRPGLTRVAEQELDASLAQTAHALPHLHGCLGFYVSRLRKEAAA